MEQTSNLAFRVAILVLLMFPSGVIMKIALAIITTFLADGQIS